MSQSEAYGGKPDYTILTLAQFQQDIEMMGTNDRVVYDCTVKVDDDLQLYDLIATIKNLPTKENESSNTIVSPSVQP
tara:strand:- start:455 stop:685 length:231 start_codon:yes stop_codon:yes gene_type:complete